MGTQKEAADKLGSFGVTLAKVNTEIQKKIQDLIDAAGNADNVSPELQSAIDALAALLMHLLHQFRHWTILFQMLQNQQRNQFNSLPQQKKGC